MPLIDFFDISDIYAQSYLAFYTSNISKEMIIVNKTCLFLTLKRLMSKKFGVKVSPFLTSAICKS